MYEPVHGSAPDIAGQGIADRIACLAEFATPSTSQPGPTGWSGR
jgi:hypothetical protein